MMLSHCYTSVQGCRASGRPCADQVALNWGLSRHAAHQAARNSLVSCLVQHPVQPSTAQAPCSSSCSTRNSVACSAARLKNYVLLKTTVAVRASLADALKQAEVLATPGSSCPPDVLAKLHQMEAAAGGRFYLISCGDFGKQHPHAGKPAQALLQLVLVSMRPDPTGASQYKTLVKKMPQEITVVQQPQDAPNPMMYLITYHLGQDGWPTGVAYSSASAFEGLTTRKRNRKIQNSFYVNFGGREVMSLYLLYTHLLQPEDVGVVPRELTPVLQQFFHDQLAAAGVEVMRAEDVGMKAMRIKQQQEQLENGDCEQQLQQAAEKQGPAAAVGELPAPNRVRRSRKTQQES